MGLREAIQVASKERMIDGAGMVWEQVGPVREAAEPLRSQREQTLQRAIDLTTGDRNRSYGDPLENFTVTTDLKRTFWAAVARSRMLKHSDPRTDAVCHQNKPWGHAIDMILANLGRLATSPSADVDADRYVDMSAYAAIAHEIALQCAQMATASAAAKKAES